MPSGVKEIVVHDDAGLKALLNSFVATGCPTDVIRHMGSWSRTRTLSKSGREAILHNFNRQRPAQRQAIIDSLLKDLTPEQTQAVYAQVEEGKEARKEEFAEKRELWIQELRWGPPTPWVSDGVAWSPGSSGGWGDNGAEAPSEGNGEHEDEADEEQVNEEQVDEEQVDEDSEEGDYSVEAADSSEEDSESEPASEAPTFATDSEDDEEDGKDEYDDELGQHQLHEHEQLKPSQAVVLTDLKASIPEAFRESDHFGHDSVTNIGTIDNETRLQWTLAVDNTTELDGTSGYEWIAHQPTPDTNIRQDDGAQENETTPKNAQNDEPDTQEDEIDTQDDDSDAHDDLRQKAMSIDEENVMQQPTPLDSPTGSTPVSPSTPLIKDLADKILPFIVDKDEPDFVRTLKQSIDVWAERGETYKWTPALERAKPRPGPSRLRQVENADS